MWLIVRIMDGRNNIRAVTLYCETFVFTYGAKPEATVNVRNMTVFYGKYLLASCSTPSWKTTPFSAVCDCLFNIFAANLHIGDVPPSSTWGSAMPWWQGPTYHGDAVILLKITRVRTSSSSAHLTPNIQHTQVWKTNKYLQFIVFLPGTTSFIVCMFSGYFTHLLLVFHTFLEKNSVLRIGK